MLPSGQQRALLPACYNRHKTHMPEKDNSLTDFELIPDQENSRFLVHNPLEIVRILRNLALRNAMVSAFFNAGKQSMLTSVLHVSPEQRQVILDINANEALNRHMLQADKIIFTSLLDQIKIQFVANHIASVTYEGTPAFSIPLPDQVLQLQRRESFRLALPITHPVNCSLPVSKDQAYQLPIGDMSMGGLSISIGQFPDIQFEPGAVYPGCRIELPSVGVVEVSLRIQSIREVTLKNGMKSLRCGCQFINLHPAMEAIIQRYLFRLERDNISGHHH